MSLKSVSIISLTILLYGSVGTHESERCPASEDSCKALLVTNPSFPTTNESYRYQEIRSARVGNSNQGSTPFLETKIYRIEMVGNRELIAENAALVSKNETRPENAIADKAIANNREAWIKRVSDDVEFVLEQYGERREHWPKDFHDKLRKMAFEYQDFSRYITLRLSPTEHTAASPSKVYGTLRLIEERDGKLPMEDYLGIKIRSNGAHKYEPGNFAIAKEVNQYTFGTILIHLIEAILENNSSHGRSRYCTYADRQSLIMYKMLGFTPLPLTELELSPGTEFDDKGRILKNGVAWTPLEASDEVLRALLKKYLAGDLRGHTPVELTQTMSARSNALSGKWPWKSKILEGVGTNRSGLKEACELHLVQDGLQPEKPQFILQFRFKSTYAFRGFETIAIPALALREGFRSRMNNGAQISYSGGLLSYVHNDGGIETNYLIETSPDFENVRSVRIHIHNGTQDFNSEAFF